MKNPYKALEAIEAIVGSDFGLDMEYAAFMEKRPHNAISRLKSAGKAITKIYMIVHSETSHSCDHPDWEKIKYKILQDENSI